MADYDPSEHNVSEVKEYLEANPDEWDAVMEAERAGKNRQGLTSLEKPDESDASAAEAGARDFEAERAEARRHVLQDPQYVMAEAAKRLNQGEGQEPFKRQDGKDPLAPDADADETNTEEANA